MIDRVDIACRPGSATVSAIVPEQDCRSKIRDL